MTEVLAGGYDVLRNVGYDKTSWYLDNWTSRGTGVRQRVACYDARMRCAQRSSAATRDGRDGRYLHIEQMIWPKLAAIAEKLWSPRAATVDADAAYPRMVNFRCVLNERGDRRAPRRS